MKITYRALKLAGACSKQLNEFKQRFGESVDVTEEACVAVSQEFNWDWAARNLLSQPAWKVYDDAKAYARKAYNDATAPARKAYNAATATAQKAYNDATSHAWKEYYGGRRTGKAYNDAKAYAWKAYDITTASAWKTYKDAEAPARKAYNDAKATAFARAFNSQK